MSVPTGPAKANRVLLTVYLSFIFISQLLVSDRLYAAYFAAGSCLIILFSAAAAPFILRRFSALSLPADTQPEADRKTAVLLWGAPLLVLLLYYIAYYPGAFSPDSVEQYRQAVSNQYSDWHPVLHTLLAFKLPLTLTGGWVGSIVLFQILLFSLSLGYCFHIMYAYAGKVFTVAAMIYILANPMTCCIAMYPWKDVAFAIGALLLTAFSLQIFMTKGAWMASPLHTAVFIAVCAVTTVFRHNAVLFTAPLLFAVLFQISPRRFLLIAAAVAVLVLGVKGPLYRALRAETPDKRQVETLGLPLNIIAAGVTFAPDLMDEETLSFASRLAPSEVWAGRYTGGSFNDIKFSGELDESVIEEYGRARVISMALSCLRRAPSVCLKSLVKLTEGIYTVTDPHPAGVFLPLTNTNPYGIPYISPTVLRLLPDAYGCLIRDFLPRVFLYYGVVHLLIVIAVLAKSRLNHLSDWKRILFVLPLFLYNYGTTLLLTGNDDSPRFFYYSVPLFPLLLIFFFREVRSE